MFDPKIVDGYSVILFVPVGLDGMPDAESARDEAERIVKLIRALVRPQATFHRCIDSEAQEA